MLLRTIRTSVFSMKQLKFLIMSVILAITICSCDNGSVTIPYSLYMTEDLARFVSAQIAYNDSGNGEMKLINDEDITVLYQDSINKEKYDMANVKSLTEDKDTLNKEEYEMLPLTEGKKHISFDKFGLVYKKKVPLIRVDFKIKYNEPPVYGGVTVRYIPLDSVDTTQEAYDFGHWLKRNAAIVNINGMVYIDDYVNEKPRRILEVSAKRTKQYLDSLQKHPDVFKITVDPRGNGIKDITD